MNFIPYISDKYGIEISYPEGWIGIENQKDLSASDPTFVYFSAAEPNPNNTEAMVSIGVIGATKELNMSLDKYIQGNIKNLRNADSNFKLLQSKRMENFLGDKDKPAHLLVYNSSGGWTQYFLVIAGRSLIQGSVYYIIMYRVGSKKYQRYLPTVEQMISTFRIL
ncbi:MAG TPA: hypothetical protein VJ729_16610 [Nitrososphaeraceae archaeon]|nr:hypothetical protein [Nitrososphaeraceae archaeon]